MADKDADETDRGEAVRALRRRVGCGGQGRARLGALGLCVLAVLAGPTAPSRAEEPAVDAAPPADAFAAWEVFSTLEDHFRVEFPAEPERRDESRPTVLGRVRNRTWTVAAAGLELSVERHEFPELATQILPAEAILDRTAGAVVADVEGQLVETREATVAGRAGRALVYRVPDGRLEEARLLLRGSQVFVVTARPTGRASGAAGALHFFESFAVLD